MNSQYCVHLVVDRAFGSKLDTLPSPIWIVDSPQNKEHIQRAWKNQSRDVTSYKPDKDDNLLEEIVGLLPTLEEHHGEYSHQPPIDALVVHGISHSSSFDIPFDHMGYSLFAVGNSHFEYRKKTEPSGSANLATLGG